MYLLHIKSHTHTMAGKFYLKKELLFHRDDDDGDVESYQATHLKVLQRKCCFVEFRDLIFKETIS